MEGGGGVLSASGLRPYMGPWLFYKAFEERAGRPLADPPLPLSRCRLGLYPLVAVWPLGASKGSFFVVATQVVGDLACGIYYHSLTFCRSVGLKRGGPGLYRFVRSRFGSVC